VTGFEWFFVVLAFLIDLGSYGRAAGPSTRARPVERDVRQDRLMEGFHEGQKVWVEQPDGSARAGVFVTDAELRA
jgi:hypothetical protein